MFRTSNTRKASFDRYVDPKRILLTLQGARHTRRETQIQPNPPERKVMINLDPEGGLEVLFVRCVNAKREILLYMLGVAVLFHGYSVV